MVPAILNKIILVVNNGFKETSSVADINRGRAGWNIYRGIYDSIFKHRQYYIGLLALAITGYIIIPRPEMLTSKKSKRPDKHTTGFINPSIDCFANATVQALSPLMLLNKYFNDLTNIELPPSCQLPPLPVHAALKELISKLQLTVFKPISLSVWDLLHVLEKSHNAKISRNQHDAHELMQLLVETLENEYNQLYEIMKGEYGTDEEAVLMIPRFPFESELESKLRCMRCKHISKPSRTPANIISLNVPHSANSTLDQMLRNNQSEVIEGYSCLVCTLTYLMHGVSHPESGLKLNEEELNYLDTVVFPKLKCDQLNINEDEIVDSEIFKSIKAKNSTLNDVGRSIVHREITFTKLPDILPIHLSRSIYSETQALRNPCVVEFPLELVLKSDTEGNKQQIKIKYKLKSIIRHQGSHHSGHYECYKAKPMFYKNEVDNSYYNLLPSIIVKSKDDSEKDKGSLLKTSNEAEEANETEETEGTEEELVTADDTEIDPFVLTSDTISTSSIVNKTNEVKPLAFEDSIAMNKIRRTSSTKSGSSLLSSPSNKSMGSSFRRRMSSIMSGKFNNEQTQPSSENTTGFSSNINYIEKKVKKDKKLASVSKHPFWRISDGKVREASNDDVLNDGKAVYMLIYERIY